MIIDWISDSLPNIESEECNYKCDYSSYIFSPIRIHPACTLNFDCKKLSILAVMNNKWNKLYLSLTVQALQKHRDSTLKMRSLESGKFPIVIGREFTPHIANVIFNMLDKPALMKSRFLSSDWRDVVDSQTNLWKDPVFYAWAASDGNLDLCQKIIEMVDEKNPTVKEFPAYQEGFSFEQCYGVPLIHSLAAMYISIDSSTGMYTTPLHIAAMLGHIEICRLIMGHLEEKNPKINLGTHHFTRLDILKCLS